MTGNIGIETGLAEMRIVRIIETDKAGLVAGMQQNEATLNTLCPLGEPKGSGFDVASALVAALYQPERCNPFICLALLAGESSRRRPVESDQTGQSKERIAGVKDHAATRRRGRESRGRRSASTEGVALLSLRPLGRVAQLICVALRCVN